MFVDSHCHLNMKDFDGELDDVISRARSAGVSYMQTICTKLEDLPGIIEILDRYKEVYGSVGVHPHDAEKYDIVTSDELIKLANSHPKIIGIGETGLDYYYEYSPKELQQRSFRNHIMASQETGKPVIVHSRDADESTVDILKSEMKNKNYKGLIHCFSSTDFLAKESLDLGFYISLAGIITFKNADEIRRVVSYVPLDRILIETDSPYLAPVSMRGKRNEPAFVKFVAEAVAQVKNVPVEEIAKITTENFRRLFLSCKK